MQYRPGRNELEECPKPRFTSAATQLEVQSEVTKRLCAEGLVGPPVWHLARPERRCHSRPV